MKGENLGSVTANCCLCACACACCCRRAL